MKKSLRDILINKWGVNPNFLKASTAKIRCVNPDHEDRTPSMELDFEKNLFNCFGCGWGGSVYDLEKVRHFSKIKLVKYLSDRAMSYLQSRGVSNKIINGCKNITSFKSVNDESYKSLGMTKQLSIQEGCEYIAFIYDTGSIKLRNLDCDINPKLNKFLCVKNYGDVDEEDGVSFSNLGFFWVNRNLKNDSYYFVEGEMDALIVASSGIENVLAVGGSRVLAADILQVITKPKMLPVSVHLYFDNDYSGDKCTRDVISGLFHSLDYTGFYISVGDLSGFKDPAEKHETGPKEYVGKSVYKYLVEKFISTINNHDDIQFTSFVDDITFKVVSKEIKSTIRKQLYKEYRDYELNSIQKESYTLSELKKLYNEQISNNDFSPYWESGYKYIDCNFVFEKGRLFIISGQSGVGKTTLCLNMILSDTKYKDTQMCFLSLEMSKFDIMKKLSMVADELNKSVDDINLRIFESPKIGLNQNSLLEQLEEIKKDYPETKVFFIDHFSLIKFNKDSKNDNLSNIYIMQDDLIKEIHNFVLKYNVTIIMLVQQTKDSKIGGVTECYRGAGSIKECADAYLQLDPPVTDKGIIDYSNDNEDYKVIVLRFYKNRWGKSVTSPKEDGGGKWLGQKLQFNGKVFIDPTFR